MARAWSRSEPESPEVRLRFDPRHRLVNPILIGARRPRRAGPSSKFRCCWLWASSPITGRAKLPCHRCPAARAVSPGTLVTVPGTGHMMHHEDPKRSQGISSNSSAIAYHRGHENVSTRRRTLGKELARSPLGRRRSKSVCCVVTATLSDDEMIARIDAHRRERPQHWRLREEPRRLSAAVRDESRAGGLLFIDCLTNCGRRTASGRRQPPRR